MKPILYKLQMSKKLEVIKTSLVGKVVTVSRRVSTIIPIKSTNTEMLLETADKALYQA